MDLSDQVYVSRHTYILYKLCSHALNKAPTDCFDLCDTGIYIPTYHYTRMDAYYVRVFHALKTSVFPATFPPVWSAVIRTYMHVFMHVRMYEGSLPPSRDCAYIHRYIYTHAHMQGGRDPCRGYATVAKSCFNVQCKCDNCARGQRFVSLYVCIRACVRA
jgi:hypothetical protein